MNKNKSVEISKKFHSRSFSEKSNYLNFVYQLGKNVINYLKLLPGEPVSLWWFSRVAETPPLKSNVYQKLISVLIAPKNAYASCGQLSVENSKCYHFLKGCSRIAKLTMRIIHAQKGIKRLDERKSALSLQDYTIVSYFPYFDREKELRGVFENRYLSAFHRDLALKRNGRYGHVCISVDIDGFGFSDSVRLANKFSQSESLFLIEEFISLNDVVRMLWHYVCFSFNYVLKSTDIRKLLHYRSDSTELDVWPILQKDFHSSFCGDQLVMSLFYISAFSNMTSLLKRGSKVISICEMQGWERTLYHFARKNGQLTIGYQHTIASILELNYFLAPEALSWDEGGTSHCPLPDYLATVGAVTADLFKENGWPEERVFPWGAQRFESLKTLMKEPVSWGQKDDLVVCAFSICPVEAERVLQFILEAYQGTAPGYRIYLKSHPSLDVRKIVKKLGHDLNQDIFEYTDIPLELIMPKAKAMVVTESSSCFYALAFGSRIIIPLFEDGLDLNPLSFLSDIPDYVYSTGELKTACDRAIEQPLSFAELAEGENFLKRYFYFPDDPEEYLAAIDRLKPITTTP